MTRPDKHDNELRAHEPMENIRIVRNGNIEGPEPSFDHNWTELDQLRWHAGVLKARTGLHCRITTGGSWHNGKPVRNAYGFSIAGGGCGGDYTFHEIWIFINGLEQGVQAERRKVTMR